MPASLRNSRVILRPGEEASFPLHGDSIRLTAANVPIYFKTRDGALNFFLVSGETATFEGQDFVDLVMYHLDGADQPVIVSIGKDAAIGSALVSGAVSITGGTVDLSPATLAALEITTIQNLGASYGASYKSTTLLAANTAETIFTAAANINGAILHSAQLLADTSVWSGISLLAKATLPANVLDGDAILSCDSFSIVAGHYVNTASLKNPMKIPAGKGLFAISAIAETGGYAMRSCLYTLL